MIYSKISGGLGNQMYQFAFGYLLAKKYGVKYYIDLNDISYNNQVKAYS